MCHRTNCRSCGRPTWSGCGNHIEQALAGVPKSERCSCEDSGSGSRGGFFSRLLGN